MTYKQVHETTKGVPYISEANAKTLYEFIIRNRPENVLELGIAHGTASCFIAAALHEIGGGKLTAVDLLEMRDYFKPSIEDQLTSLGLNSYVDIHRMNSGYNWFLHDDIKERSNNVDKICVPKYDLIIIDGPKNWTIDSSSFFLANKLLKENGWIIWDDVNWTYKNANQQRESTDGITHRGLSEAELSTPHIKAIFELLVMQHPDFGEFIIQEDSDWAWARKTKQETKTVHYKHSRTLGNILWSAFKKLSVFYKTK